MLSPGEWVLDPVGYHSNTGVVGVESGGGRRAWRVEAGLVFSRVFSQGWAGQDWAGPESEEPVPGPQQLPGPSPVL